MNTKCSIHALTRRSLCFESQAMCLEMDDESITLDGNHPLAGNELTFEMEVMKIAAGPNLFGTPIKTLRL